MKIENQVTSREIMERLVEKGFKMDTLFWYPALDEKVWRKEPLMHKSWAGDLPAPTVAEWLERLPLRINDDYYLELHKDSYGYAGTYLIFDGAQSLGCFVEENPADALALLYEWLLENGHLTEETK